MDAMEIRTASARVLSVVTKETDVSSVPGLVTDRINKNTVNPSCGYICMTQCSVVVTGTCPRNLLSCFQAVSESSLERGESYDKWGEVELYGKGFVNTISGCDGAGKGRRGLRWARVALKNSNSERRT